MVILVQWNTGNYESEADSEAGRVPVGEFSDCLDGLTWMRSREPGQSGPWTYLRNYGYELERA
jgi:hypothetical protein